MKQDNINYFAVGLLVLLALGILFATIARLTGGNLDSDDYFVRFTQITALREGSSVTFNGYQIGRIAQIAPERSEAQTWFRLRLAIQRGWPIPEDSIARITASGLLTENQVDITEGRATRLLTPGDTLHAGAASDVKAMFDSVAGEFAALSREQLRPLLAKLDNRVDVLGDELATQLPKIMENVNLVLARLGDASQRISSLLSERNLEHVSRSIAHADEATAQLAELSSDLRKTNTALETLLATTEQVVTNNRTDLRQAIIQLRSAMDTLAHRIEPILFNLESTTRNAEELTRKLRNNPSALLLSKPPQDPGDAP
jgi:phospholipid/cholesterol/gamma-HCH transport system substrate-binding protein